MSHIESVAWIIDANRALQASEKMRRLEQQKAKRVIGVVVSAQNGTFVLKAATEPTVMAPDTVTVIN